MWKGRKDSIENTNEIEQTKQNYDHSNITSVFGKARKETLQKFVNSLNAKIPTKKSLEQVQENLWKLDMQK